MGRRRGYDVYEATKARLAEKDPKTFKQDKYLRQTGPKKGEFAPYRLDRELTNFLNLDTMRSGLSTKFPKFLIVIVDMFELKFLAIDPLHTRIVSILFSYDVYNVFNMIIININ